MKKVIIYIIKRINGRAVIADKRYVFPSDVDFFLEVQPCELDRIDDYRLAIMACNRYNNED